MSLCIRASVFLNHFDTSGTSRCDQSCVSKCARSNNDFNTVTSGLNVPVISCVTLCKVRLRLVSLRRYDTMQYHTITYNALQHSVQISYMTYFINPCWGIQLLCSSSSICTRIKKPDRCRHKGCLSVLR